MRSPCRTSHIGIHGLPASARAFSLIEFDLVSYYTDMNKFRRSRCVVSSQTIVIILGAILMGWFAIGMIYNLRRGDAVLKWMQDGLPSIGQKTTFRWLGTSVAEMVIAHAKKPFRRLDTLLVFKPRDIFWMTIAAYFQGRDDIVIFRAQLSTAPLVDLELIDPKTWSGRGVLKQMSERKWESKTYQNLELLAPKGLLD